MAVIRGPYCTGALTPAGTAAQVVIPQAQRRAMSWCSVTRTAIGGRSLLKFFEGSDGARWVRQGQQRRPEHRPAARRDRRGAHVHRQGIRDDTAPPKLDELIAFVRDGGTVIAHSMDRLAATST